MPRYSKKQRQALQRMMQEDVCRVAGDILRQEGSCALTMDRIACEIGVSRATLYNYFADRDAVLTCIDARLLTPLMERLEAIAAGLEAAPQRLEAMIFAVLHWVSHEDPDFLRALHPVEGLGEARMAAKMTLRDRALAAFETVIRQGVAAGELRDLPPARVSEIVLGALTGLIETMKFRRQFLPPEEVVPPLVAVLLGGLKQKETP